MVRITVNNISTTEDMALENAKQIFDQTGSSVEICNTLGDTMYYINKAGKVICY